jgi:hypothetical protein
MGGGGGGKKWCAEPRVFFFSLCTAYITRRLLVQNIRTQKKFGDKMAPKIVCFVAVFCALQVCTKLQ